MLQSKHGNDYNQQVEKKTQMGFNAAGNEVLPAQFLLYGNTGLRGGGGVKFYIGEKSSAAVIARRTQKAPGTATLELVPRLSPSFSHPPNTWSHS